MFSDFQSTENTAWYDQHRNRRQAIRAVGTRINAPEPIEHFLAYPPDWMAQGACGSDNAELMDLAFNYQDYTSQKSVRVIDAAKAVCAECPVREMCLQFQLEQESSVVRGAEVLPVSMRHGVWAGTTPRERFDMAVEMAS